MEHNCLWNFQVNYECCYQPCAPLVETAYIVDLLAVHLNWGTILEVFFEVDKICSRFVLS